MWTFEIAGTSKARLLKLNGTPVAKFYADRLTQADMEKVARVLNGAWA